MKIRQAQLSDQLLTNSYRLCWLNGDSGWWMEEARAQVEIWLRGRGFVVEHHQGTSLQLTRFCEDLSLWSEKRAVEYCYKGAVSADLGRAIEHAIDRSSDDEFMVLITNKLDAKQRQSKWYRSLEELAWLLVVPIWPLESREMQFWLQRKLKDAQVKLTDEARQFLMTECQGNPAAIVQTINKMVFFNNEHPLWNLEKLRGFLVGDVRFSAMDLVKATLKGDAVLAVSVIDYFQQERLEIAALFWSLIREIRLLITIKREVDGGSTLALALKKNNVWFEHRDLVVACYDKLDEIKLLDVLATGQRLDTLFKSMSDSLVGWNELREWCLLLQHALYSKE